jgi:ABC-type polysaccharide/polyol phosphate export permease
MFQLYCHEDNLNWGKVGSLLTLIVLLGAVFAFFWKSDPRLEDAFPIWSLMVLGLIVHGIFVVSITSGLRYMMARKNCVIQLEERIAARDGNLVPLVTATKGLAPTAWMLYAFPYVSLVAWCIGAVLILARVYR